jgi:hypothetical protein
LAQQPRAYLGSFRNQLIYNAVAENFKPASITE